MGFFSGIRRSAKSEISFFCSFAVKINWRIFDEAFKKNYSEKMDAPGQTNPAVVSLLILKYACNLNDRNLVQ